MAISITLGWWLVPAIVTALLFVLAIAAIGGTSGHIGSPVAAIVFLFLATMFSLIAWLTWGVLT